MFAMFVLMSVHVLQSDSSCRVLSVESLEDPVLEQRVHGDWHNGNKCVDWRFLQCQLQLRVLYVFCSRWTEAERMHLCHYIWLVSTKLLSSC